jgi:glucosamine--fructose-6-phosphate aminotransferase (isomerizing)
MSAESTTAMARETAQAAEAVERQFRENRAAFDALGKRLAARPPRLVATCARGSSDNAAFYLKYLVEIALGLPCCSIGASVVSVYDAPLKLDDALFVTVSQSGRSPDVVALQAAARKAGAFTVALVNDATSPVANEADLCLPLHAGPETSVAATKSFVASLAAAARIVSAWAGEAAWAAATDRLPEALAAASQVRWEGAPEVIAEAGSLYVLGRGPSYPIALEAALKLKETCAIHAEAYSAAEVMHGPLELVGEDFPVLVFSPGDRARPGMVEAIARLRAAGATVLAVEPGPGEAGRLPYADPGHPFLEPVSMVQSFYRCAEETARLRGRDPDRPRMLRKVTETV